MAIESRSRLDPVTLEVLRNALPAIANEMSVDLQRTSYNMMIYEVRDYCTALLNTKGELISQNVGGVSHFVADLGVLVVDGMQRYGADGFKPGDVIITNHQAVAGQHLNNVVIYMPYFYKGELLMFLMVRAHWIDVGGTSTGFGAGATVADLGVLVVDGMKRYGRDGFKPGDVVITNHQAVAGQHLNNVVIYMPYFYKGELLMFCMVRAHWIDVGGQSTGFGAGATVADPWFEGLQLDQLKIYEEGKLNETLYRVIKDNIRFPESSLGDMKSQMAACRLAARRMDELFDKYGKDTILAAISQIFDETEQKCRNVVVQLPDGIYEAEASIDDDGLIRDEEVPIRVKITIKGSDMTIDLSGCSAERKAAINSRTYAGARVAYKALTGPLDPVNEGSFRALKVVIPEGNIMMAKFPAPMSGWSAIVPTVVDTIVVALAKAMPDRVPAGHHGLLGGSVVFFGLHPKTKRRFIVQSIEGGGWGGRPFEDGESATVSVCQGDVRNGSIEGIELKCPVLVESRALRRDSCGAGKYRGGLGLDMKVRNLVEGKWNFERTRRSKCPPWGIAGGTAGEPGGNLLKLPGEKAFKWITGANIPVPLNSLAIVRTGGGGGWGDPLERDAALVAADAAEGLISRRAAHELYGVVLRGSMSLDESATQRLRDRLRSRRKVRPAKRAKQQKRPSLTKGRKRR
ncbi:MAG: hydantoinase B/oxoprolinase family protein [Xanthobacteraceae bacterium]